MGVRGRVVSAAHRLRGGEGREKTPCVVAYDAGGIYVIV